MKKFFVLILSCFLIIFIVACNNNDIDTDESNKGTKTQWKCGVVFQVKELSDINIEDKICSSKDDLIEHINTNFSDCKYICVFKNNQNYELFGNLETENTVFSITTDISLQENQMLLVYQIYFMSEESEYMIKCGTPSTSNFKYTMEFQIGEKGEYIINAKVNA